MLVAGQTQAHYRDTLHYETLPQGCIRGRSPSGCSSGLKTRAALPLTVTMSHGYPKGSTGMGWARDRNRENYITLLDALIVSLHRPVVQTPGPTSQIGGRVSHTRAVCAHA